MVAFSKVSMLLGAAHALQSETVHQVATDKGIIGRKEVAEIGAGMAALAGITAGAKAIGASASGISDRLSDSSSADDDSGGDSGCDSTGSRTFNRFVKIYLDARNP